MKKNNLFEYILYGFLMLLFVVELFVYFLPEIYFFSILGVLLWIIGVFLIAGLALKELPLFFLKLKNKKCLISIFILITNIGIILINTPNPGNVSRETTLQIHCMLNHLKNSPDMGFISTCFGNYPARQYLVPALPSLILGRDTFPLNLGGSIYPIIGLILLTASIIKYFGDTYGNYISALFLSGVWHFHYFIHFTFHYEQSIFPVSLTAIGLSFLLNYLKEENVVNLLLFGFSLLLLIHAYTSGLAVYFLGLVILGYLFFKSQDDRFQKTLILLIIIISLFSFLSSLAFRTDIKLAGSETASTQLREDFVKTINHVVFQTDRPFFVSPIFQYLFLFSLLLGISGSLGNKFILVGLWIVAVIFASALSKGYSYYGIPFRLHRATVIAPVCVLLIGKWIRPLFSKQKIAFLFVFLLAFSGYYYVFNYQQTRRDDKNRDLAVWLNRIPQLNQVQKLIVTNDVASSYPSFEDAFTYYAPDVEVIKLSNDCNQNTSNSSSIFLVSKNDPNCYSFLIDSNFWWKVNEYYNIHAFFGRPQ